MVEEGPAFVLHFCRPPDTCLPYRIENHLRDASITYYQKVFSQIYEIVIRVPSACIKTLWRYHYCGPI